MFYARQCISKTFQVLKNDKDLKCRIRTSSLIQAQNIRNIEVPLNDKYLQRYLEFEFLDTCNVENI